MEEVPNSTKGKLMFRPWNFDEKRWKETKIYNMNNTWVPMKPVLSTYTCEEVLEMMKVLNVELALVLDERREIVGVASEGTLRNPIHGILIAHLQDPISKYMSKKFTKITLSTTLPELNKLFEDYFFALVMSKYFCKLKFNSYFYFNFLKVRRPVLELFLIKS